MEKLSAAVQLKAAPLGTRKLPLLLNLFAAVTTPSFIRAGHSPSQMALFEEGLIQSS
jgi:hypothetical protein